MTQSRSSKIYQIPDETERWWMLSLWSGKKKHTQVHDRGDTFSSHMCERVVLLGSTCAMTQHCTVVAPKLMWSDAALGGTEHLACGLCPTCCVLCEAGHTKSPMPSSWPYSERNRQPEVQQKRSDHCGERTGNSLKGVEMVCLENGKLMWIRHETVFDDIIRWPAEEGFPLFGCHLCLDPDQQWELWGDRF